MLNSTTPKIATVSEEAVAHKFSVTELEVRYETSAGYNKDGAGMEHGDPQNC